MNNEYSLIGNEDNHVVMDNRLIESKQMMPLNAAKIVRMAIAKITYEDEKFRTYSCSITELADFLRVSKSNLYHDIRWMCDVLERSCVFVSTDNPQKPWERLQWIDYARYDGKGTLAMRLAKDVEPYLVSLRKCYTQYRLRNIIDFNSFYAIRLYEMLIHQVNLLDYTGSETISYTISELRELLFCETKLLRFADFRRKVLNVAVREINEKSDIFIVMSFIKKGNDIRHSPEETAETELEEVLSEEEDEAASELREEAGAEEEIESESILHETAGFLSANGQSQGMTREMLTLFNGAQYAGTILTGRLTGVERIPLGIVATISYNKNDGTLNNLNGVTVKINADKMGLRMDLIRRGIAERNERIGLHPSEEMFETQVRNYQFRFLRKMLGAKIDFVTEEIVEDANTVVGNRERAMERMRANFTPQRGRERARYVKGDNILSRVLRVSDNALVVEASGYEVAMTVRQVTPMAVVLPEIFKPGDNFPVIVTGISDTGISLIGAQGARVNIFQKVHEYRYGSVVLAEVIHIYRGVYHLKMPNGCRGAMFFNKALLRTRVREGDMVTAIVIGFSENDDAVKCSLR